MKVFDFKAHFQKPSFGVLKTAPVFTLLLSCFLLAPHAAMAQAFTLGELMCNVAHNVAPLGWLMNGLAYIIGAVLIGNGAVLAIRHAERPGEAKLHLAIMHMIAGAGALFLPSTISWLINSLFDQSSIGGTVACVTYAPVSLAGGTTLDGLMTNLIMNIKDPMVFLLSVIAMVIGVFLIIRGLIKGAKYGLDPKTNSVSNIVANLIIGTILFVVGQSLDVMLNTVFGVSGVGASSVISWSFLSNFGGNTQQFQAAIYAALTFFQLIGMIAFIRGFLILKSAVEGTGQATVAQGLTHILGGVLAVNIYYFLVVMDNTFGTGFLS